MYTMFGMLFIFSSHFLFRGFQTGKTKYYLLFGLFLGLASLTHYMGIITFPIFLVVFWGWKIFHDKMLETKFSFSKLKEFFPSKKLLQGYGIFALVFSFWIPIFYRHLFKVGTLVWIKPATLGDVFTNIQIFILGSPLGEKTGGSTGVPIPNEIYGIAAGSIIVCIAIFLAAITFYLFKKEEQKEKVISVFILSVGYLFLVYILSLLGGHYLISRYLSPSAYFLYIFLGLWISRIRFSYAISSFIIYLIVLSSIVPVQNSTGWKGMENDVEKYSGKDFYVLNPFDYVIARYYLGPERIILYNLDSPDYTAGNWAAIGPNARSVKNFDDIRNDKNGLVLSNTIIDDQVTGNDGIIYRENLNSRGLENIYNYENISIYQFR
jgi:4-amino-4-deoxy-L-arabinose transferase-like glycosyltransferase